MRSRGLYRSRKHRLIAGVAGGMAERFGLPVLLVRLVWLLLRSPSGLPGLAVVASICSRGCRLTYGRTRQRSRRSAWVSETR
jgi:phage shock protein C